jgi:uncharacterized protein DUF5309
LPATVMNPAITSTYVTTGASKATNVREDLANLIYRIDPDETPLVSALSRKPARQILTEWLTETLNAADVNKQPEGWQFKAGPPTRPARISNVCQLMTRSVTVSGTLSASDTVGTDDEYDRQMINRGIEIKRDLEYAITRDTAKDPNDPRAMAGIPSYITNGSAGAGAGVMPTGDGSNGHTPGTARAMTLSLLADAMQQAYIQGGKPTIAVMSPALKRTFSGLTAVGGATNTVAMQNVLQSTRPQAATYVGAVDVYLTDFGQIQMVVDLFAPAGQVLLVDTNYAELAPLRDIRSEEYAKTGDARSGACLFEGCVRVTAPKAHAALFDLL